MEIGVSPLSMMTPREALKLAEIRWEHRQDVRLADSLDRRTTLSIGWFQVGPRRGLRACYAVRLGVDHQGVAMGGCCLHDTAAAALETFHRYAGK